MDRKEILAELRSVDSSADLDVSARAADDWLREHPDDDEVRGALEEAKARTEPRTGYM
jgi:hypothetical protein